MPDHSLLLCPGHPASATGHHGGGQGGRDAKARPTVRYGGHTSCEIECVSGYAHHHYAQEFSESGVSVN